MAEVRIGIGDQELVAVITRSSAERLGLKVGDLGVRRHQVHRSHDRERHRPRMNAFMRLALVVLGAAAARRPASGARAVDAHRVRRRLAHRGLPGPGPDARAGASRPDRAVQLRGLAAAGPADRAGRAGRRVRLRRPALDGLCRRRRDWSQARAPIFARNRLVGDRAADQSGAHRRRCTTWRAGASSSSLRPRPCRSGKYSREALREARRRTGLSARSTTRRVLANVVSQEENVKSRRGQGAARRGRRRHRLSLRRDAVGRPATSGSSRSRRLLQRDRELSDRGAQGREEHRGGAVGSSSSSRAGTGSRPSSATACCRPPPRHRPLHSPDRFSRRRAARRIPRGRGAPRPRGGAGHAAGPPARPPAAEPRAPDSIGRPRRPAAGPAHPAGAPAEPRDQPRRDSDRCRPRAARRLPARYIGIPRQARARGIHRPADGAAADRGRGRPAHRVRPDGPRRPGA